MLLSVFHKDLFAVWLSHIMVLQPAALCVLDDHLNNDSAMIAAYYYTSLACIYKLYSE